MKISVTPEQKWTLITLAAVTLGGLPSFFMSSSSSNSPTGGPVEVIEAKGDAVPIMESSWSPRAMSGDEQEALTQSLKIDLNHADLEELGRMPNVGPATAQRIIDYRESHGCFREVEELMNVKGFGGGSKYEAVKDHIRVDLAGCVFRDPPDGDEPMSSKKSSPKSRKKSSSGGGGTGGLLNINTASVKELDALPGIGKVAAQKIIDYRDEHGSFGSIEELMEVPGIKTSTFDKVKDHITAN